MAPIKIEYGRTTPPEGADAPPSTLSPNDPLASLTSDASLGAKFRDSPGHSPASKSGRGADGARKSPELIKAEPAHTAVVDVDSVAAEPRRAARLDPETEDAERRRRGVQGRPGVDVGGLSLMSSRYSLRFSVKGAPQLDIERHYARCNATRRLVSTRILCIMAIIASLGSALGGAARPAALFHFAQLGVVPILSLCLGLTFSRRIFQEHFELLMCCMLACFSFSQRTLYQVLIGFSGPYVLFVTAGLLIWITCSVARLRFHVSCIMTGWLVLEFVVPTLVFWAVYGPDALRDWSWRCLLGILMSSGIALKGAFLNDDLERALFAHELRAVGMSVGPEPSPDDPLHAAVSALVDAGAVFERRRDVEEGDGAEAEEGTRPAAAVGAPRRGAGGNVHPLGEGEGEEGPDGTRRAGFAAVVFGRRIEPPELDRAYWKQYAEQAWERSALPPPPPSLRRRRARVLSLPLTAAYIVSIILTGIAKVIDLDIRFGRIVVQGVGEHINQDGIWMDWIFELGVCGGVFLAGCALFYLRPRVLRAHANRMIAFGLLMAQLACLTSIRRLMHDFENPDYQTEFWPKLSMLANLYFLAGAFRMPPRTFLLFSSVSILYALEVFFNPHGMNLLLHLIDFVIAPFAAAACLCAIVEANARRRFLLEHAVGPIADPTEPRGIRGPAVAPA